MIHPITSPAINSGIEAQYTVPNSLTELDNCYVEPALADAKAYDSFQFVRNGFFCADYKDSREGAPVFNRIVSLKSSFKLPKQE